MKERDEVLKLARLSKLTLSEEEINSFAADMQSVISFADMISTADFGAEGEIFSEDTPLREDILRPSYSREDILQNAPSREDGYFKLQKTSENK